VKKNFKQKIADKLKFKGKMIPPLPLVIRETDRLDLDRHSEFLPFEENA